MKLRSLIPLSGLILAVALVALPNEAVSTPPLRESESGFEDDTHALQYKEDAYGNPKCDGRCGGRPCCETEIFPT
jgi:hypothetical protein